MEVCVDSDTAQLLEEHLSSTAEGRLPCAELGCVKEAIDVHLACCDALRKCLQWSSLGLQNETRPARRGVRFLGVNTASISLPPWHLRDLNSN